jgi:hypothetical protein
VQCAGTGVLAGHTDREIIGTVAVGVPYRECGTEPVLLFGRVRDSWRVLRNCYDVAATDAGVGAPQHYQRAGERRCGASGHVGDR